MPECSNAVATFDIPVVKLDSNRKEEVAAPNGQQGRQVRDLIRRLLAIVKLRVTNQIKLTAGSWLDVAVTTVGRDLERPGMITYDSTQNEMGIH